MTSSEELLIDAILERARQRRRNAHWNEEMNTQALDGLAKSVEASPSSGIANPSSEAAKIKMRVARQV